MRRQHSVLISTGMALALGCGQPRSPESTSNDGLFVASGKVYDALVLTTCWEETGFDDERFWVQDALLDSWEAEASIELRDVGQCSDASANLHLHFQDKRGSAYVGTDGDGRTNGVNLNTWASSSCTGGWSRERCVRSTAVHELGHAFGFDHEQNRSDRDASCPADADRYGGDTNIGDWDRGSVMNYCNPVRNGDGRLSGSDIRGMEQFYGPRRPVAAVNRDGVTEIFYRGTDAQLWHVYGSGDSWSGHVALGGDLTSAPAAVSWGADRMDVFVRAGNEGRLEHTAWTPAGWHGWESLDRDGLLGQPIAVARGTDQLDVFVRTLNGLSHRSAGAWGWSGWAELGTPPNVTLVGNPAVASWSPDHLEVFVRATDNGLWHCWWNPTDGWSGWDALGGILTSNPEVVSWAPGSLEVFGRGIDGALWHIYYHGNWSGWESLGGVIMGDPIALAPSEGRMNVVVQGSDLQVWHLRFDNGWGGWEPLAGVIRGSVALSTDDSRLMITARGSDDGLYVNDEFGGWLGLGGVIR